jgi:hypothetical protein
LANLLNGNARNLIYSLPISLVPSSLSQSAITISGYIAIDQPGTYNFNLVSSGGSQLTIGNQFIISAGDLTTHPTETGVATFEEAGLYPISIEYVIDSGDALLEFWMTDSQGACFAGRNATCDATAATDLFYATSSTSAPEPGTLTMFAVGVAGIIVATRRRRRA